MQETDLFSQAIKKGIILEKKAYHHGNLHETLLEESMAMIHEDGMAQFSLRKLAKRVGVSPTACYNHFSNIDDLMSAITDYIDAKFADAIQKGIELSLSSNAFIILSSKYLLSIIVVFTSLYLIKVSTKEFRVSSF